MCFYLCEVQEHKPNREYFKEYLKWKIASKPIKVYKILGCNNTGMCMRKYKYHKGFNFPEEKVVTIEREFLPEAFLTVLGGVLHSYKESKIAEKPFKVCVMYIPKGYKYFDNGIVFSKREVISMCLYWPKNLFDRILWWFKSL